jgi:FtsH-binding integral membrane protein
MKTESDLPSYEHPFAPARDDNVLIDEGLRQHILRVYGYMGIGLVVTGLVAVVVATAPALYVPIFSTPLKWLAILAPLAFAFLVDFRAQSMSASTAQTLFWSFCAIMGLSLAAIFLIFAGTSVARTFFIAAAMFAAMGLYGYTTHRDLSAMGAFIVMGLVGVLMASLANILVASSTFQVVVSVVGVAAFVGLAASNAQSIEEQYAEKLDADPKQKLAVLGALALYLNLINIFQLLLYLTGEKEK